MIEFKDVRKVYTNGTVALDGVDLKIEKGEFAFIVGHSGAGKTTLMKLLLREEKVSSGALIVNGYDLSKMPDRKLHRYRRRLGVVFQDFRLFPNKTVYENIVFAMRVVGTPASEIRERVPLMLDIVNLASKKNSFPHELSGGEQQRVALARALANNPDIIIADEPTGNIDPQMSLEIMNLLMKINKLGKTVLIVTHDQHLVDLYNQRVITIDNGLVTSDRKGGMFA